VQHHHHAESHEVARGIALPFCVIHSKSSSHPIRALISL
jgi:hypothetical protein